MNNEKEVGRAAKNQKQKKKILLVDNEKSFCLVVKINLEATGEYEVKTETEGLNALRTAQEFKPDLLLMDMIMPGIRGADLARQIKLDPALQKTPVIFLTATVMQEEAVKEAERGNGSLLAKPISVDKLLECIRRHVPN